MAGRPARAGGAARRHLLPRRAGGSRSDALVLVHPLADSRRVLPLEHRGELLHAHPDFLLVASYNPGYRGLHKGIKPSTRQRFTALSFDYPVPETETAIVAAEGGIEPVLAGRLVALAGRTRRLQRDGLEEGASTRLLVHAATCRRRPSVARRVPAGDRGTADR